MAKEFQVRNVEEFESLVNNMDFRISEALVSTVLKNLKGTRRHHHALSVVCEEEQEIYDVTIDRQDFVTTLLESLPRYEEEEKYEECIKIQEALKFLKEKIGKKKI
jgi:hypothetical protein